MMRKLVMLALLTAPVCQAAEPLGRLFFTPNERAELDRMRRMPPVAEPKPVVSIAARKPVPPSLPASNIVTVNGIVQRSDGSSTVWINNQPLAEDEAHGSGSIKARGVDTITVARSKSQGVEVKVGQTINPLSGEIRESYSQSPAPESNGAGLTEPADPSAKDFSPVYSVSSKAQ